MTSRQRSLGKIALGFAVSSAITATAFAHGGATGIVKERMDLMLDMGNAMKVLKSTFKGDVAYDAASVRGAALRIRQHSGGNMTKLFPEGSLQMGSEARTEIWTDWERFEAMAVDLEVYTTALAHGAQRTGGASAGSAASASTMMGGASTMMGGAGAMMGGAGAMMGGAAAKPTPKMLAQMPAQGLFNLVAQTCSNCHTQFRSDKK